MSRLFLFAAPLYKEVRKIIQRSNSSPSYWPGHDWRDLETAMRRSVGASDV